MSLQRKLLVFLVRGVMWFGLMFYLFTTVCQAADVTLALNPNSTVEPAGYKLYVGEKSKDYTVVVDLGPRERDIKFTVTLPDLLRGKIYYFAATAYDGQKNESSFSRFKRL